MKVKLVVLVDSELVLDWVVVYSLMVEVMKMVVVSGLETLN